MWSCPKCHQQFVYTNAMHSCGDKSVDDFLKGKSDHTIALFHHFLEEYRKMGDYVLHPAKSRISLAAQIRFAFIVRLGRDFMDVVFQFREPYEDNMCFYKITQIPGTQSFNHYVRFQSVEDLNDEVRFYMQKAYDIGQRKHLNNKKITPDHAQRSALYDYFRICIFTHAFVCKSPAAYSRSRACFFQIHCILTDLYLLFEKKESQCMGKQP